MELENCIIETENIENDENEINLENNRILFYSEDGEETEYEPYAVENGQIILRRVDHETGDEIRLESDKPVIIDETNEPKESLIIERPKSRFLNKKIPERRKLSYENDFKPCSLPANRGGLKGFIRYGRKHLIIDQQTMISPREFKQQLNDCSDIIMKPEWAPSTKKQMSHVISGITRLFAYPSHKISNNKLLKLYMSNCTTRKTQNEENITDMELKPLGFKTEIDTSKIKRITRKRKYPEAEQFLLKQQQVDNELVIKNETQTNELIQAAKNAESSDHVYTKSDFETVFIKPDEQQIYIMQSVDENGVLKNIEVLLAAAETQDEVITEYQEIQTINSDSDNEQKIYFVQEGTDQVICLPEDYIITN